MTKQNYDMDSALYCPPIPGSAVNIETQEFLIETGFHRFHYHETMEIGICLDGRGTLYTESDSFEFSAGDVQIILPFVRHISVSEPSGESRWLFTALRLEKLILDSGLPIPVELYDIIKEQRGFNGILHPAEHPDIAACVQTIIDESQKNAPFGEKLCTLSLLSLLYRLKRVTADAPSKVTSSGSFRKILPALLYLEKRRSIQTKISDLAAMCCVSETYFRSLFYEITGFPPKKYIQRQVISDAEYLLRSTCESIEAISATLGFSDPSGFYRMFVACIGMSPSDYRHAGK
ncbi:MAG: helix-turn-helix transcriptional regulator [Clostridia bacterium]|nr:helix-turn-helix transcriptional regulator [Clostridia bacterium]